MSETKLKTCPFCGSKNIKPASVRGLISVPASCNDCGAHGPQIRVGAEADAAWNERNSESLTSALFAAFNTRLEQAEKRYQQEQTEGDDVSIAGTRATFLGWMEARYLVRHQLKAQICDNKLRERRAP
jgi:Lar family restriction alleviation protein